MKEIELKILEVPKKEVFKKLLRLGAKKKYAARICVRYFDFPDHRIHKRKDLLRVREFTFKNGKKKTEIVYKKYGGIKNGCKIFQETEFIEEGKDAFEKMSGFFKKLRFIQTLSYEKKRTLFEYRDFKFEFDEHPKIPPFMEIESSDPGKIKMMVKKLGLQNYELSPETIEQLMKRKYPHIKLNGLKFKK